MKTINLLIVVLFFSASFAQDDFTTTTAEATSTDTTTSDVPSTEEPTTEISTTAAPTVQPPTTTAAPGTAERECGCTHNQIWLDIVAVIDNSQTMTQEGLSTIQANLDTVIHELTLNISGGWASRVAIVTFNSKAVTVANLTRISNVDDFENTIFTQVQLDPVETGVNILSGLQAALDVIKLIKPGPNRRSVVILFTSAYNNNGYDDPIPMANSMKSDNIKLITVAFAQRMESDEVKQVAELAYPNFNLTNNQADLIDSIYDRFCQANCFCAGNWLQYRQSYADETSRGFGICLYYAAISSAWQPAKFACHGEAKNAYLASELSQAKHDFNVAYTRAQAPSNDYDYHIGLSYNSSNGQYQWEQPVGQGPLPLTGFSAWNLHFPNQQIGNCVRNTRVIGQNYGWSNEDCWKAAKRYLCQVNTCDTDNYCGN